MDFLTMAVIRMMASFLILRWPLLGIVISAYIDGQDWHYLNINSTEDFYFYRVWDKSLDIYYLSLALFISFSWKDKVAKIISIISFAFRVLGILLFSVANAGIFLFIFPNFFENFIVFYLLYTTISKKDQLFIDRKSVYIVISSILIPKILIEYFFHIKHLSPFQLVNVGSWLNLKGFFYEYTNEVFFAVLYLSLPVLVLIWTLKRKRFLIKNSNKIP